MTDLEQWLIGEAESITDIAFLARVIILVLIINLFGIIASQLASVGKK